ncbi:hypothetical protein M8332_02865 [Fructilactobacillus ixorae]|uniref:Uncharacterized protein n=1 Tax=Fructilactobacillus ixorae TaxID=1750535 RepID=A0ABY5C908_9LACO|nr:hypothetical protein [Fructilactobacillus ixorae]USS93796.1 hypothetical protein M8332_02865 [Fructilactobacillus ixorae]
MDKKSLIGISIIAISGITNLTVAQPAIASKSAKCFPKKVQGNWHYSGKSDNNSNVARLNGSLYVNKDKVVWKVTADSKDNGTYKFKLKQKDKNTYSLKSLTKKTPFKKSNYDLKTYGDSILLEHQGGTEQFSKDSSDRFNLKTQDGRANPKTQPKSNSNQQQTMQNNAGTSNLSPREIANNYPENSPEYQAELKREQNSSSPISAVDSSGNLINPVLWQQRAKAADNNTNYPNADNGLAYVQDAHANEDSSENN